MDERNQSKRLRFTDDTQGDLVEGITSGQLGSKSELAKKKRRLLFEDEQSKDSAFMPDTTKRNSSYAADESKRNVCFEDDVAPHGLQSTPHKTKSRLQFKHEDTVSTHTKTNPTAAHLDEHQTQLIDNPDPKLKQKSNSRKNAEHSAKVGHLQDDEVSVLLQDSNVTVSNGSSNLAPNNKTAKSNNAPNAIDSSSPTVNAMPLQDPKHLAKPKLRVDKAEAKLSKAQDKLTAQKPYKPPGFVRQLGGFIAWRYAHKKAHEKIYEVEHENVGTESAHKTELAVEGGIRTTSRIAKRRIRTMPARRVRKLTKKAAHARANHAYQKLLHDNPALKKKALTRFFQKRRLKMQYVKQAKQTAQVAKQGGGIITKVTAKLGKAAIVLVKSNPKVLLVVAIFAVLILILQSCMALVTSVGSSLGGAVVASSYLAEDADIDYVTVRYTEWETNLHYHIIHAERDNPGHDEYRFNIGDISHNPFELVAFLTAVYNDFTYAQARAALYNIFNEQYQLEFISEVEIRTRIEERTGSWEDEEGNTHTYTYTVVVEYEWHILNVILTSQSFRDVILSRMDAEQTERFHILMLTKGNRQYLHSPFDFNWLSYVTSLYGYRINPFNGTIERHWGLDIGLPEGTPILSGQDGTVIFAAYTGGYGFLVVIDDGEGLVSRYAHCSVLYVNVGDVVSAGDVIARVGSTGQSTGAHLHLEVIKNGRHLNPLIFTVTNHHLTLPSPTANSEYVTLTIPLTTNHYITIPIVTNHNPPITTFETEPGTPMSDAMFAILLAEAENHLGTPYVFGANGPDAFDCSSFVCWVFTHSGVYHLPRTTAQGIFNQSIPIPRETIQPGDLVFFTGTFSTTRTVTHVGIYTGDGFMIHAGSPVSYAYIHTPF